MVDVKMPQLGETVADGTVAKWFKGVGDAVTKGEALFEVSTDKVDTEIPAQASGIIAALLVNEGETVDVGTVLAVIQVDGEEVAPAPSTPVGDIVSEPSPSTSQPTSKSKDSAKDAGQQLSPVVRRLLGEHGLQASDVVGTGPNGRITKDDVLAAATKTPSPAVTASPVVRRLLQENGLRAEDVTPAKPDSPLTRRDVERHLAARPPQHVTNQDDEIVPFSRIRKLTAEHMVRSKATSAHTLMVREIDYEAVERVRREFGPGFKEREGFSLTYLSFNARAAVLALADFPRLNASVGDDELIVHHAINLGIAVDLDSDGLVVPVIRKADTLGVPEIARAVHDRATRARTSSLGVDDVAGGTFTITNPGPFGTLLTGAVINQPQVAILSTDAVTRRPVVVTDPYGEESVAIHSTGLLALTFDHRAVDGAYAARYLQRVAVILQEHDWADEVRLH